MEALETVKIGAVTFDTEFVHDLKDYRDDGTWRSLHGRINYTECVIRVEAEQHLDVKRITVLHEAIHAILDYAGQHTYTETQVEVLGVGVFALLKENPALVRWLGLWPDLVPPPTAEASDANTGD